MTRRRRRTGTANALSRTQAQTQRSGYSNQQAQANYRPPAGGAPGAQGYQPPAAQAPVGPPPPDPQLIAAQAATQRGVGLADAQATFDEGRIGRDFGYNAQGAIDPSNPYSRAALLQRNFQQQQRGTNNSMAAQGQLYSGANQTAQNANAFGYLSDSNSLRNQYTDSLGQTSLNRANAYSNAGSALSPEILASIRRALGQG